ncbi:MAG TPA: (2Fe-2S)-binding protein [Firmicutes bacterium]|nr:(2Fe-2S)-binding protein [Bacillota bacterium]
MKISFNLNGEDVSINIDDHITLLEMLRDSFELYGAKEGCGYGECGSCTVIVDDMAINSCLMLAVSVNGRTVVTVEGLAGPRGELDPLQQAFVDRGAVQCGFCTPGMIMSAKALLKEKSNPGEEEIRKGMAGNLCRCTGYSKIVEAIKCASEGGCSCGKGF